jgi:cytochrome P450
MSAQEVGVRPIADEFTAWYTNDPTVAEDPYPFFHRLRAEAPVFRQGALLVLTRYADCAQAAIDTSLWKTDGKSYDYGALDTKRLPAAQREKMAAIFEMEKLGINKLEGPQHARVRALVQKAFTPRTIERLQRRIEEITTGLLDAVGPSGRMDAINDFAYQLPLTVICEMLDVPVKDRERIRTWGLGMSPLFSGRIDDPVRVVDRAYEDRVALFAFMRGIVRQERSATPDSSSVMSMLVNASNEGLTLSEDELVGVSAQMVFAGHETTTNAIGNGIVALMTHRDQWDLLRNDPSLVRNAVDEILRYEPPVHTDPRFASATAEIGGETIHQGDRLRLIWAAANRDPDRFAEPDRFDVTREDVKHLAFGVGRHYCLGASLARLEIGTAIGALVRRFPDMRMAEARPRWRRTFNLRGVTELPLVLGRDHG